MMHTTRMTALCLGLALLVAPVGFVCGELGAMPAKCAMGGTSGMSGMQGHSEAGLSICRDAGQMAMDCCDIQAVPEPVQVLSVASARLLAALEVTTLQALVPPAAVPLVEPPDAGRWRELERYTLFSSLLL